MITRRKLLRRYLLIISAGFLFHLSGFWGWIAKAWAFVKEILPKGFSKSKLKDMNPAHVDPRNLDLDPTDKFGTMGPTDISVDLTTYRLRIGGGVNRPLSLTYEEILKLPSITADVLLVCPGYFANYGRWTGVHLKTLLQASQPKGNALLADIKGGRDKVIRIRLDSIEQKKVLLAYRVNGETLPQKHGFPLRLVYEDVYGDEWVKYVDEIVVLPDPTRPAKRKDGN
jgi:DMSO/TMAO reductase YedYZ molybdopterin-dependent catalytic subunit